MSEIGSWWAGLPGTSEHHTNGRRAWCHLDGEWCAPTMLCNCCDSMAVPERWRGMYAGELLTELAHELEFVPQSGGVNHSEEYRAGFRDAVNAVMALVTGHPTP